MGSGILLMMFSVMVWMEIGRAEVYSTKLMHRFSEEMRAIWISRGRREGNANASDDDIWPQKGSSMYYRRLLSSDLRRQKLKKGLQFQYLFPSEGSTTLPLGNDFGWCSLVFGASIVQDKDLNEYNPSGSTTKKDVSCSHQLCKLGSNCKSPKQPCPYIVNYDTDDTSTSGLLVEDILYLASGTPNGSNKSVQARVIIGCGSKQSGGYLTGVAPDGLMGLGLGEISVPSFLAREGLSGNSFSLCFNEDDTGRLFFGDQGIANQHITPFLPSDIGNITYLVGVEAFCIASSCLEQTDFKALVDSGTSFTYLPDKVYHRVVGEFNRQVNTTKSSFEGYPWQYCYKSSSQERPKAPFLSLKFAVNNSFEVINPVFVIYDSQGAVGFCLAVQPADSDIGTIGQNFMTGYRMVFDRENKNLGWSQSNCEDLSDGSTQNPLPATEQQTGPNGDAVAPAISGRTPSKSTTKSTYLFTQHFHVSELLLLMLLIVHIVL